MILALTMVAHDFLMAFSESIFGVGIDVSVIFAILYLAYKHVFYGLRLRISYGRIVVIIGFLGVVTASLVFGPFLKLEEAYFLPLFKIIIYCIFLVLFISYANLSKEGINEFVRCFVLLNSVIGCLYIGFVLGAQFGFEFDIPSLKYYSSSSITRVALIYNEPLYCGLNFILALCLALHYSKVHAFVIIVAGVMTFSVLTYVALTFVLINIAGARGRKFLTISFWIRCFIIIGIIVALLLNSERGLSLLDLSDGSTRQRIAILVAAFSLFTDYPFLGMGWGVSEEYIASSLGVFGSSVWMENPGHTNVVTLILADIGIVGFLFVSVIVFRSYYGQPNNSQIRNLIIIMLIFLAGMASLLIPILWLIIGLALSEAKLPLKRIR